MSKTLEKPAPAAQAQLVVRNPSEAIVFEPALLARVQQERQRVELKRQYYLSVMTEGLHYGTIPGVAKPTLLKPGAELLISDHALCAELSDADTPVLDFMGEQHKGEAFIRYRRRCALYRQIDRTKVVEAEGVCNSWETKYRYRESSRKCPVCAAAAIIKGKEDYGGGWLCFKKKGGCGAKFYDDDDSITSQKVGRIPNPDIADVENTVLKIADKRAFIAAALLATGASDIFTQDIEDDPVAEAARTAAKAAKTQPRAVATAPTNGSTSNGSSSAPPIDAQEKSAIELREHLMEIVNRAQKLALPARDLQSLVRDHNKRGVGDYRKLNLDEAKALLDTLEQQLYERSRPAAADADYDPRDDVPGDEDVPY